MMQWLTGSVRIARHGMVAVSALAMLACRRNAQPQSSGGEVAQAVHLHAFHGNVQQARAGRVLFLENNCYSCHGGLAGGAMGPSLRDSVWKYGGADNQIYASIRDGRPMGMPTWGGVLADSQIRDLVAYIRSLRTPEEPRFFFWAHQAVASR